MKPYKQETEVPMNEADYTCEDLLFWFWLLYRKFDDAGDRKDIITSAVKCRIITDRMGEDLIWAFCLRDA